MDVKLPNFLIVGAAKSGTTSLYYYLKQHPEVYMSPRKEPKFIMAQFIKFPLKGIKAKITEKSFVKTFDEYKNLFKDAIYEKAIGEATTGYLYYYKDAIKYIKKYLGEVKIIIILRNPVERAFSHYTHLTRDAAENLSFEDALEMEQERINDGWVGAWHYASVGFYYYQVKAYMDNFCQVKVYLFDDLLKNPLALMKDIYKFLEVDSSFIPNMETKYNVSGIPKNKIINYFIRNDYLFKSIVKPIIKPFLPKNKWIKYRENLNTKIENLRTKNLEKVKIKPETREYLKNLYREDILKLQGLIGRDLSHWLKNNNLAL